MLVDTTAADSRATSHIPQLVWLRFSLRCPSPCNVTMRFELPVVMVPLGPFLTLMPHGFNKRETHSETYGAT